MPVASSIANRILSLRCNPSLAIAICGLLGSIYPAAYACCTTIPEPHVHDEFCYLLAGDTFAHGRLANPTPELPEFFEVEHVLVVPTYMAKYPPGQGLCLAAGQVLFGHPIFGVWLGCGAFSASLCWMLQGWTAPRWALATTLSVILTNVTSYWCQSYWGGMAAACGGALLFGGLRRTLRRPRISASLMMGLGIVVLAITRPFEGLLACLPVATIMVWWLTTDRTACFKKKFTAWLLPIGGMCLAGGAAIAIDNQAVTGDWRQLPHGLHQRQYFFAGTSCFSKTWTPSRIPCDRIAAYYVQKQQRRQHERWNAQTISGEFVRRAQTFVTFGLTADASQGSWDLEIAVLISVIVLIAGRKKRWAWFCWATIGFYLLGAGIFRAWFMHYSAPVLPLLYGATAMALHTIDRASRAWLPPRFIRPALLVVVLLTSWVANYGEFFAKQLYGKFLSRPKAARETELISSRTDLLQDLLSQAGAHLVFVRYSADYSIGDEWVYNAADMQSAPVLFAHDLGFEKNRQLIERHRDRQVWLASLTPGDKSLVPYHD